MITFGEIQMTNAPTLTNRQLINVKITLDSSVYDWQIYTPLYNNEELNDYLTSNADTYEKEIKDKEELWSLSDKTRIIDGIEVPISKWEVVKPTVPDHYEISASNMSVNDINSMLSSASIPTKFSTVQIEDLTLSQAKEYFSNELVVLRKEMAAIITECKLLNEVEPEGLSDLISSVRTMYSVGKSEISSLTEDDYKSYVLRGPGVLALISELNKFL